MTTSGDREQAAVGARILQRLKPAPDKGAGYRRDPETGFVFYSSEWLGDRFAEPVATPVNELVEPPRLRVVK